jgi:hypothetical protein
MKKKLTRKDSGRFEEPDISPEEDTILDRVWDRIVARKEGQKKKIRQQESVHATDSSTVVGS